MAHKSSSPKIELHTNLSLTGIFFYRNINLVIASRVIKSGLTSKDRHIPYNPKTNQTRTGQRAHTSAYNLLTLKLSTLAENLEKISSLFETFTQKDCINPLLLNDVINTFLW